MTLIEKAALLPDATTEELFKLILEMAMRIEKIEDDLNIELTKEN